MTDWELYSENRVNCDTLLHASVIITQDDNRSILENSSIAISGGKILELGPTEKMLQKWRPTQQLDMADMLVMPGLINAHTHAAMTFARGFADDMPLMPWLEEKIFPLEGRLNAEITYLGSLLGYAEMLASGTTACVDMYLFENAVFEAADYAGIRCMGGEAVFAFPSAACPSYQDALTSTALLAKRFENRPRLKVAVNPHSVYTTTPEILVACRELALNLDAPIHIHLAETEAETERCLATYGMRPIDWCDANGLFDCRVIAAHLVDITEDEADFLARKKACACHNPASNMKLASGTSPVSKLLAAGVPVGLGTDGPASNNTLNLFTEMNRAALLQKLTQKDPCALPAQAVLDMATLGGARIFGDSGLGRLAPGCAADCLALDLSRPHMQPMHNPVSQVVYAASGYECRMTMIEGEIVYQDGEYSRFSYEDLKKEIKKLKKFVNAC